MSDDPAPAPEPEEAAADVAATTPPVGISSRMIFVVALICIAGFAIVSGYILRWSGDVTLIASVEKSWDWAFAMAIGYILGSSAGSRNKDHR